MTRALRHSERTNTAALLRALADELEADHAHHVQAAIATAAAAGYPTTTSGTPTSNTSSSTSRPEALTINPDQTAAEAHHLNTVLRALHRTADTVLRGLQAWRPDRRVRACPRCGHPLQPGQARCQRMTDDGRRCGVCREADCPRAGRPMEPGEKMRDGRCDTCRQRHARRQSTAVASVDRIQLQDNVITTDEGDQL